MAPYETTEDVIRFYEFCNETAREYGFQHMGAKSLGGGSDAAYLTLAGIPAICSFGVQGQWNHTDKEYALVDSLFERSKLIGTIILNLGKFN